MLVTTPSARQLPPHIHIPPHISNFRFWGIGEFGNEGLGAYLKEVLDELGELE